MSTRSWAFFALSALSLLGVADAVSAAAEDLPKLGVTLPATSVSGLSAGAYMAGQIEIAHSKDIVGAGIVAGGPFACAETTSGQLFPYWPIVVWQNATQAANACMKDTWGAPDADKLAKRAKELAEDGKIDELSGLADDKVYLFSGNEDQTVVRAVVEAAKRFYEAAGVPEASVTLVEKEGGHAFLSETEGTACGLSQDPYVSDCDYDQAKAILEWIYGSPLADPSSSPTGKFVTFDQSDFNSGVPNGLAAEGVVYVPEDCVTHPGCRLHIALHGCDQAREMVGDAFIEKTGFARYADTNRLVVLFPQIAGSVVNPHGCWDWWGYSDIDYLGKDAPQIKAVWAMAERLAMQP
ncbi:extracellular catalytic domain type 2 short-chain-length polyhydroxyalkanoate depolymerase [Methyloceanibacter sp.]|uniref:extracellular catalytic domain type 2 short-chain-length polyhydroxyalkanoate depolymerase n=1 Tax=Methyloceanibacter sp. TaxID=1965321 RepID=UPI003D6C761C